MVGAYFRPHMFHLLLYLLFLYLMDLQQSLSLSFSQLPHLLKLLPMFFIELPPFFHNLVHRLEQIFLLFLSSLPSLAHTMSAEVFVIVPTGTEGLLSPALRALFLVLLFLVNFIMAVCVVVIEVS